MRHHKNTVEPRYFEVPREMEKKFEIAGFRNNRESVKFVTMNHFLLKYVCNHQKKKEEEQFTNSAFCFVIEQPSWNFLAGHCK